MDYHLHRVPLCKLPTVHSVNRKGKEDGRRWYIRNLDTVLWKTGAKDGRRRIVPSSFSSARPFCTVKHPPTPFFTACCFVLFPLRSGNEHSGPRVICSWLAGNNRHASGHNCQHRRQFMAHSMGMLVWQFANIQSLPLLVSSGSNQPAAAAFICVCNCVCVYAGFLCVFGYGRIRFSYRLTSAWHSSTFQVGEPGFSDWLGSLAAMARCFTGLSGWVKAATDVANEFQDRAGNVLRSSFFSGVRKPHTNGNPLAYAQQVKEP